MKSDDPTSRLDKIRKALASDEAAIAELETDRRTKVGHADVDVIRGIDTQIEERTKVAGIRRQQVAALELEVRKHQAAEHQARLGKDLDVVEKRVTAWAAAAVNLCEIASELARAAALADKVFEDISRDYSATLPTVDLSAIRIGIDRTFRTAFTRPGARLNHMTTLIGPLDQQIQDAAVAAIARLRASVSIADENSEAA